MWFSVFSDLLNLFSITVHIKLLNIHIRYKSNNLNAIIILIIWSHENMGI